MCSARYNGVSDAISSEISPSMSGTEQTIKVICAACFAHEANTDTSVFF